MLSAITMLSLGFARSSTDALFSSDSEGMLSTTISKTILALVVSFEDAIMKFGLTA